MSNALSAGEMLNATQR